MKLTPVILFFMCSSSLYAVQDLKTSQPSKSVQAASQVPVTASANTTGQKVYENHCIICHRDGVAGAPRFQNEKDWNSRLNGRTIDDLQALVIKGVNAMPPKGTCSECSDSDLKSAIEYMLPQHD